MDVFRDTCADFFYLLFFSLYFILFYSVLGRSGRRQELGYHIAQETGVVYQIYRVLFVYVNYLFLS